MAKGTKERLKLLIAEPDNFSDEAYSILSGFASVDKRFVRQDQLLSILHKYDAIMLRLSLQLTEEVLSHAPKLKFILCPATGLDHIDTRYTKKRGITILSLQGEIGFLKTIPSTAELTIGLMIALLRNIPQASASVRNGDWNRDVFRGHNLAGKKLGILGFGRVGKQVAKIADALNMEVGFYEQNKKVRSRFQGFNAAADLLEWCNILSIHIPVESNKNYLTRSLLKRLKKGSWAVNTSRAAIWDEDAILDMLQSGHIAGIATDVIGGEPHVSSSKLIKYSKENCNLLITPHLGGATFESMERCEVFIAKKLRGLI